MVSEHGLTMKDYEDLKTVEISLKTGALNETADVQIKSEPRSQATDKSQAKQQCSEEPEDPALKSDEIEATNSEATVSQEDHLPQPPPTPAADSTSTAGHVEGEENPKEPPRLYLANMCRFQCNRCGESFGSWRELRAHVGRAHSQRYIKCNFNEYAVVKVYHNCTQCKAKVLQDYDAIRLHMLTHGIKNLQNPHKNIETETILEDSDYEDKSAKGKTVSGPESPEIAEDIRDEPRVELGNSAEGEIRKKTSTSTSARNLNIRLRDVIKGRPHLFITFLLCGIFRIFIPISIFFSFD